MVEYKLHWKTGLCKRIQAVLREMVCNQKDNINRLLQYSAGILGRALYLLVLPFWPSILPIRTEKVAG